MSSESITRKAAWPVLVVVLGMTGAIVGAPAVVRTPGMPRAAVEAVEPDASPTWETALDSMDRAVAAGDTSGAERAWRNAYRLALHSRQWQALLAVGEDSLRISDHVLVKQPYRARAREAWRDALFRAGAQHSVEGLLRVAEAFARLGDTHVVTQALRIADGVAAADASGTARRRVLEARQRLTPPIALSDRLLTLFPDAAVGP